MKLSEEKENEEKKDNLNFNILFMMQMLFPTKFPASNNINYSFEQYIENNTVSVPYTVPSHYSYLKLNNKIYTVIKITILNDIVNNPIYREMIELYNNFTLKNEQASKQNEKDIIIMLQNIFEKMGIGIEKNDSEEKKTSDPDYLYIDKAFEVFTDKNKLMLKDIYDENNNDIIKDEKEIEKTISKLQNDPNAKYNRERLSLITNYLALKREINEMYNKLKLYINKNKKVEVSKLFTENSTFYEDMQKVSESLKSIKKSLKSITEIKQITGESSIEKIANNIMKDFTKIDDAIKVHNKLSSSKLKINMDNEEGNVKDLIAKKNPMFNKFVEKIKNIIENHKTNNEKLLNLATM